MPVGGASWSGARRAFRLARPGPSVARPLVTFRSMGNVVRIDPRVFINAPFGQCPKCAGAEFGSLMFSRGSQTRRCRACWHTESRLLPVLQKKMVYLDQMAYSGMAKTLDPVWAATTAPQGPFPAKLFDALERALKLQLIVCPNSTVHEKESALASQPTMLRAVYEHLGNGVSFEHPVIIHQHQLGVALRAMLARQAPVYNLPRDLVLHGDPDEWMDRIRISVNLEGMEPNPNLQRTVRARSHSAMLQYFEQWRSETGKKFDDWYRHERTGQAETFMILFKAHAELLERVRTGHVPFTEEVWNPRLEAEVIPGLMRVAEQTGHSVDDALRIVLDFLFSDVGYDAPANDISAMLVAAVARKAASGQRRPPSPGMWNDITAIASFLPYCDAMFLDNECAGLLREEPLRTKLAPFGTRIFSSKTGEAFLAYLTGLELEAGPDHVRLVGEVYGDDWSEPYREILVHERERQARKG